MTLEYAPDNVIELYLDDVGRRTLIEILARLEPDDHEHLFTESWGGYGLTEDFPNRELTPVYQLTIQLVGKTTPSD